MDRDSLVRRFRAVRQRTERLMAQLHADDYRIQSMPDVSPPWWNLGHTTWLFVANVLRPAGVPFADHPARRKSKHRSRTVQPGTWVTLLSGHMGDSLAALRGAA
jgi:hypothetical protein